MEIPRYDEGIIRPYKDIRFKCFLVIGLIISYSTSENEYERKSIPL